jgi:hypothetical protein
MDKGNIPLQGRHLGAEPDRSRLDDARAVATLAALKHLIAAENIELAAGLRRGVDPGLTAVAESFGQLLTLEAPRDRGWAGPFEVEWVSLPYLQQVYVRHSGTAVREVFSLRDAPPGRWLQLRDSHDRPLSLCVLVDRDRLLVGIGARPPGLASLASLTRPPESRR